MAEFTVNSDNIGSRFCQYIAPFDNKNFIIAGLSTVDYSPCLLYSQVYPLYNWNFGWYDTQHIGMFDDRSQQVLPNGLAVALPGEICVPPRYTYNPFSHSLYDPSAKKPVPINATVCNSSEVCSTPQDDQNETQAETYNASTHKLAAIDATVCNSSEICRLPMDVQNTTSPEECTPYDNSFFIGMGTGALSSTFIFLIGIAIYHFCHNHKSAYKPAATFEHDALELAGHSTTQDGTLVATQSSEGEVHV